jgi:hypothetical protein
LLEPFYAPDGYLYASPNIIRVIRLRKMNWAGNVARMGEMRNEYKIVGNMNIRVHPEDKGVNGRIILQLILGI